MTKRYTERCSCNAELVMEWDLSPADLPLIKDWRENHRHELSEKPDDDELSENADIPHIFESQGAAIERSWTPESEARPTVSLGFQRNEVH